MFEQNQPMHDSPVVSIGSFLSSQPFFPHPFLGQPKLKVWRKLCLRMESQRSAFDFASKQPMYCSGQAHLSCAHKLTVRAFSSSSACLPGSKQKKKEHRFSYSDITSISIYDKRTCGILCNIFWWPKTPKFRNELREKYVGKYDLARKICHFDTAVYQVRSQLER